MSGFIGGGGINTSAPRIASVQFQTSVYGKPVPVIFGMTRISANLIDYDDFVAHKHKESAGGKGGGATSTTYTYSAAVLFGMGEKILGINRVWSDKQATTLSALGLTMFIGDDTQTPFGYWTTNHPTKALSYRGESYLATGSFDLGSNASLPNLTFEVAGLMTFVPGTSDAIPTDVNSELLTNATFGAGFSIFQFGDMLPWYTYCIAANIFISPAYTEQKPAQEILKNLAYLSNTALFFSEGVLKAVPYGDETLTNSAFPAYTYTPNTTPVYDLTLDDFICDSSSPPVKITRSTNADAFNQVQVKFRDRAHEYNDSIAEAKDQANIFLYGLRPMPVVDAPEICDATVAQNVAPLILQRALYVRNQYEFTLPIKYLLLEQMDIVTLTEPGAELDHVPVRILSIEDDENNNRLVIAEEYLGGVASAPLYANQEAGGYVANYNADPGDANQPVIFEPPENLAVGALEAWIFASGGDLWGGCQVWVSSDDVSYSRVAVIENAARQGVLTATLATNPYDPDTSHTLAIDVSMSDAQILSGSQVDVDSFNTLCYVDGELISYRDSNLTSAHHYNLTYLRRGVYNTPVAAHTSGAQFVRIDKDSAAKYPFDVSRIGSIIYIKLVSFNIWGGGLQDISAVTRYSYTITGAAMNSPPDDVTNLHTNHRANLLYLYWDEVTDFRAIEYEIRSGPTWPTAIVLGSVAQPGYPLPGNGTFWIGARAIGGNGARVYSVTPISIAVSGAALVKNVVATLDENATGWTGTRTGGAVVTGGTTLQLNYDGDVANIVDLGDATEVPDLGAYGNVQPSGSYEFASTVTIADIASCTVQISFDATAFFTGVGTVADPGPDVDVIPQIALSQNGVTWGAWQDYKAGVYTFKAIKARVNLASRNTIVTPQVQNLKMLVDVPDKTDAGHVTTLTTGTVRYTYASPYNGGNDSGLPIVQTTILGASAGDQVRITNKTLQYFDIDVVNSAGTRVARGADIFSQAW